MVMGIHTANEVPNLHSWNQGGIFALKPSVIVVLVTESMSWVAVVALALLYLTAPAALIDAEVDGARFHRLVVEIGEVRAITAPRSSQRPSWPAMGRRCVPADDWREWRRTAE
jgi:hypothetical protein